MRCPEHPPAKHARQYPTRSAAIADCEPCCEVVVAVKNSEGVLEWGVIPAFVETIPEGVGLEPVRQPGVEFVANWWTEVETQVREERSCTEG